MHEIEINDLVTHKFFPGLFRISLENPSNPRVATVTQLGKTSCMLVGIINLTHIINGSGDKLKYDKMKFRRKGQKLVVKEKKATPTFERDERVKLKNDVRMYKVVDTKLINDTIYVVTLDDTHYANVHINNVIRQQIIKVKGDE